MVGCVGNISRVWEGIKRRDGRIENSDPNQNNPFITAAVGIGGAAISIFFPDTKPIVDGVKPLAEKGLQEAFRKDKLTEGQKILISSLRFLSLFCIVVAVMIGVCLIWSFNGWSFWKVTGYFLLYVFFCSASMFPNIFIIGILEER
ncbi:putative uncharacterized protein [Helicobacter pylori]|nr:putative uncharacterized protein [Helicobacter pylori]